MTTRQRGNYERNKARLRRAASGFETTGAGCLLRFSNEPGLLVVAAEFIEAERVCCPFYSFGLDVLPHGGGFELRITGPAGTANFIHDALILPPPGD